MIPEPELNIRTTQWHHDADLTIIDQCLDPMNVFDKCFRVHDACLDLDGHSESNDPTARSLHGDGMSIWVDPMLGSTTRLVSM